VLVPQKWRVVLLLWMVCWLNYADRQAIFALFPLLRQNFGVDNLHLALLGSSFMWVYALAGPLAGFAGDRFSRRKLILGSLMLWMITTAVTILSHSFWQLVALRAVSGLAEAVYFPSAMSLIASWHCADTRSRAMSLHQSAVYVGTIGGGVLAALAGQRYGWRASFLLFELIAAVVLVLLVFLLPTQSDVTLQSGTRIAPPQNTLRDAKQYLLGNPLGVRLIVAFVGANFVAMMFLVWLPSFLYGKFHLSVARAGASATLYLQLAAVCGVILGGFFADRAVRMRKGGRMKTQAFGLLLGAPFLFLVGWSPLFPMMALSMICFGVCKGIYESNIWASLYDVVPAEFRSSAVGLMNAIGWLGGGLAPLALAAASKYVEISWCVSATAGIYLCAGLLLLKNSRRVEA